MSTVYKCFEGIYAFHKLISGPLYLLTPKRKEYETIAYDIMMHFFKFQPMTVDILVKLGVIRRMGIVLMQLLGESYFPTIGNGWTFRLPLVMDLHTAMMFIPAFQLTPRDFHSFTDDQIIVLMRRRTGAPCNWVAQFAEAVPHLRKYFSVLPVKFHHEEHGILDVYGPHPKVRNYGPGPLPCDCLGCSAHCAYLRHTLEKIALSALVTVHEKTWTLSRYIASVNDMLSDTVPKRILAADLALCIKSSVDVCPPAHMLTPQHVYIALRFLMTPNVVTLPVSLYRTVYHEYFDDMDNITQNELASFYGLLLTKSHMFRFPDGDQWEILMADPVYRALTVYMLTDIRTNYDYPTFNHNNDTALGMVITAVKTVDLQPFFVEPVIVALDQELDPDKDLSPNCELLTKSTWLLWNAINVFTKDNVGSFMNVSHEEQVLALQCLQSCLSGQEPPPLSPS